MLLELFQKREVETAFFSFLDAVNLLWQSNYTLSPNPEDKLPNGDPKAMYKGVDIFYEVVRSIVSLHMYLPCTELDIKLHNVIHIAMNVAKSGPPAR
jgi:hypothetical protein